MLHKDTGPDISVLRVCPVKVPLQLCIKTHGKLLVVLHSHMHDPKDAENISDPQIYIMRLPRSACSNEPLGVSLAPFRMMRAASVESE